MTVLLIVIGLLAGIGAGLAAGYWLPPHGRRPARNRRPTVRTILVPFTGQGISRRAFDAAVRLARAEHATMMPAFLACVPRTLPIESPLPAQCADAMPLMEAIEQQAAAQGLEIDARVARGRTYRDALRRLLEQEPVDRVIVSATDSPRKGLTADDLQWLLERVPAEVLILRPAPDDTRRIAASLDGHF
ncbi:MAG TPA: universal stress protein [Solirubrobacteraceae bacterium]|nr:universal stress protein [Solirubrobacteraceae bacterium]